MLSMVVIYTSGIILYLPLGLPLLFSRTISVSDKRDRYDTKTLSPSDEARLVKDLLDRYEQLGKVARPKHNASEQMTVQFGLRLIQMDIIEKDQLLKVSAWCKIRWIDEYLQWEPEDYGMIETIVLPWDEVWTPDIALVNTAETKVEERHADIMVGYHGAVTWLPQRMFKSACLVDVTHYPYDRHKCHMWFQSMSRYSWQMNLRPLEKSPWDLDTYLASFKESQEWEILENITERYNQSKDVGVLLKFSRRVALRFTLSVQRRKGYTSHLLIMPCVLLASMTLIVFCLPPERPDRHTLAMGIFGSYMVLLLILIEWAPPSAAATPILGVYYACNMTLVMASVFCSSFVIHVIRRGDRKQPVPHPMKLVFIDYLSRVLIMHERVSKPFNYQKPDEDHEIKEVVCLNDKSGNRSDEIGHNSVDGFGDNMKAVNKRLRNIEDRIAEMGPNPNPIDKNLMMCRMQWRSVGIVMDRMFCVVYVTALMISLITLCPRPP